MFTYQEEIENKIQLFGALKNHCEKCWNENCQTDITEDIEHKIED